MYGLIQFWPFRFCGGGYAPNANGFIVLFWFGPVVGLLLPLLNQKGIDGQWLLELGSSPEE